MTKEALLNTSFTKTETKVERRESFAARKGKRKYHAVKKLANLTIYTITSLGGIGIPFAIVKYVAEFRENKEKLNICHVLKVI